MLPDQTPRSVVSLLTGAPLDVIKLAAAGFMLVDHVNTALLRSAVPLLWRFGRIAFPLFCLVLAVHLARGMEPRRYVTTLLLFAIVTQPMFAVAFSTELGNVLFTLAAGAALASNLIEKPAWTRHLGLLAGIVAVFALPLWTRTGVDFGLPGMLFPAALALMLVGSRLSALWLAILVFSLNAGARRGPDETWLSGASLDAAFAVLGGLAVLVLAAAFRGQPRFLPRYALHAFYPGHLLVLALIRWLGMGVAP